jgi:hypothetical protein
MGLDPVFHFPYLAKTAKLARQKRHITELLDGIFVRNYTQICVPSSAGHTIGFPYQRYLRFIQDFSKQ